MMYTLTIHHDGREVFNAPITTEAQIVAALAKFPPPQARGSVAQLRRSDRPLYPVSWTSGHSMKGPQWQLLR